MAEACEDSDIAGMEVDKSSSTESKVDPTHAPIKRPKPKGNEGKIQQER